MPAWYPLETDHDADPMRPLVATGSGLHTTEQACVQILARPFHDLDLDAIAYHRRLAGA